MSYSRILLVENDRVWQEILAMHIRLAVPSADLDLAGHFPEAKEKLAQGHWNVLVTDIGLPPASDNVFGMQLVKLAYAENVRCIVVSGTEAMTSQLVADAITKYNAHFFSKDNLGLDPDRQTEFQQLVREFAITVDDQELPTDVMNTKVLAGKVTINARMIDTLQKNPEAQGWSVTQWTNHLGCSRGGVAGTPTWRRLSATHKLMAADQAVSKRRNRRSVR